MGWFEDCLPYPGIVRTNCDQQFVFEITLVVFVNNKIKSKRIINYTKLYSVRKENPVKETKDIRGHFTKVNQMANEPYLKMFCETSMLGYAFLRKLTYNILLVSGVQHNILSKLYRC